MPINNHATTIKVVESQAGQRIDMFLHMTLGQSRSYWQKEIKAKHIRLDGGVVKPSYHLEKGNTIKIQPSLGDSNPSKPPPSLKVVYEDVDMLVIDKPAGLLTHPVTSASTVPTVADFAVTKMTQFDQTDDRPGIVHRLDKDTSGLLIIAKTHAAKTFLQHQFKQRLVRKTYLLLVLGTPSHHSASIKLPLSRSRISAMKRIVSLKGRPAITNYRVISSYNHYSLIEARPETGRTHQLRVHFAHLGHPVAGDIIYGSSTRPTGLKRQFLHASELEFKGPDGRIRSFSSPLPSDLQQFIIQIEKGS